MQQTITYTTARPVVSSPLASNASARPIPKRNISYAPAFPTSRPLRPFASIANATIPSLPLRSSKAASGKKPIKIIEPPKGFRGEFVLNLTQAELRRED
ncbi:hypothetical protein NLI96_g7225 [Meripilus lineatus]|uniref:Uncharacterized protein n=1 Tax=Meripilus lineatus TaxID=2056292 RepID=A0AAD5UZE1_9APHY|nr:hypothetical protein NLI96_g7225 [Physisporinus lineatus]